MRATLLSILLSVIFVDTSYSAEIDEKEVDYQNQIFKQWWEDELVWNFEALPKLGVVPTERIPYSGHDYPDAGGGTVDALRRYDQAFNNGEYLATDHERHDIQGHRKNSFRRGGLLGLRSVEVNETPRWYGHCNAWTAASIRHAEPQNTVVKNGVTFTPASIKGLLVELYMYADTEFLGGVDEEINPGIFHVVLANWVGRGSHPIGAEITPGKEVWNYPIYGYAITVKKMSDKRVDVRSNVYYVASTTREFDKSPVSRKKVFFHYALDLDDDGNVIGGEYARDSARWDMLWMPLKPVKGGDKGNESGNPHLDPKNVLAIWRESVPEAVRKTWLNIDPTPEDRVIEEVVADAKNDSQPNKSDVAPETDSNPTP